MTRLPLPALLLALLLVLAACTSPPVDPYALEAQGARLVSAARGLQTATADAYIQQMLDLEATRRAGELHASATQGALVARQTAVAVEQTAAAGHISATATAAQVTRVAAREQQSAMATATRLVMLQQTEAQRAEGQRSLYTALYTFAGLASVMLGLALAVALARLLWLLPEYAVEWADRRRRMLDTASGPFVYYQYPDGAAMWMPAGDAFHLRPRRAFSPAPQPIPPAERLRVEICDPGEPDHDDPSLLAGRLVLDAIGLEGEQGAVIPSWRALQDRGRRWSSRSWQRAVQWLNQRGAVDVVDRNGTYLTGDYPTLYALNVALVGGKLRSPSPPPEARP